MENSTKIWIGVGVGVVALSVTLYLTKDKWLPLFKGKKVAEDNASSVAEPNSTDYTGQATGGGTVNEQSGQQSAKSGSPSGASGSGGGTSKNQAPLKKIVKWDKK